MATAAVHVSSHPCLRAKLSQLRSMSTGTHDTKRLVHEISLIVGTEALASGLNTSQAGKDTSPLGYEYTTETISPPRMTLVPILRSGLSMVDALQTILPYSVSVHHLGMYREKTTLQPVEYYNNLPYHSSSNTTAPVSESTESVPQLAIVVDPVIATGQTMCAAIETLRDWGVPRIITISVLGSKGGLEKAAEAWPEGVEIWVGGMDGETDERGMIKPGLGDIGDRLYMTVGK